MKNKITVADLLNGSHEIKSIDKFKNTDTQDVVFEVFVDDGTDTRLLTKDYKTSLEIAIKFPNYERKIFKRGILHTAENINTDCASDWLATIVIDEDGSVHSVMFKPNKE